MLTGRPVNPRAAGTAWAGGRRPETTVHAAAGHYVTSAYDLVHDYGYPTAFLSNGADLGIVDSSWGKGDGSADRYGADNGRDKISHYALLHTDSKVVKALRRRSSRAGGPDARLRPPRPAGERSAAATAGTARSTPPPSLGSPRWSAVSSRRSRGTPSLAGTPSWW